MLGSNGSIDYALMLAAVSLFSLGTVCFTASSEPEGRLPLAWLGWAAALHGALHGLELWNVVAVDVRFLDLGRGLVVLAASVCLVEFWARYRVGAGLRRNGAWGYFALLVCYAWAVALDAASPFRWTIVLFELLCALLVADVFIRAGLGAPGRDSLFLYACGLAALGCGATMAMESWIVYGHSPLTLGEAGIITPPQTLLLLQACILAVMAACVWWLGAPRRKNPFSLSRIGRALWLPAALAIVLAASWMVTEAEGRRADAGQRRGLIYNARLVGAALDREMLSWLGWSSGDAGRVAYLNLRRRLTQVAESNREVVQAMLYQLRDGAVVVGVASMPRGSQPAYGPGEVVQEQAGPRLKEFWRTGEAFAEGPVEHGASMTVTAHVPVTRTDDGRVLSALSMNILAQDWYRDIAASRQAPLRMTLLTSLLLLGLFGTTRLRLRHELDLAASERRYRSLFESMIEGVAYCRIVEGRGHKPDDFVFLDMNPAAESLLGKPREAMVGKSALQVFPEFNDELQKWIDYFGTVARTGRTRSSEIFYKPGNCWFKVRGFSWKPGSFAISFSDITERRKIEKEHRRLALLDPLTELPNRRLFRDRLDQALARADRSGAKCAVLYLDLNDFKAVNDNHGHAFGDVVLSEVADRLRGCMRRSDTLARIGGDEFVAVIPEIRDLSEVAVVASKIKESMTRPFAFGERVAMVGVSIGVSIYPDHGADAQTILVRADAAMYSGKGDKSRQFVVYEG